MKRIAFSATLIMLCTLLAAPVKATEPMENKNEAHWFQEIRLGVLAHDVDHLWSGSRREGGVDLNAEIVFGRPNFSLLSGKMNPNFGLSVNTQGDTSSIYGGILWEWQAKSGVFFDLGLGAAVHNGKLDTENEDKKSLGSRVLFRIPIELGYAITDHHQISILFVHMSNGYLANPNQGLDELGLRYGYRF